jgi:hypothetical protein
VRRHIANAWPTHRNGILWHLQAAIEATHRVDALPGLRRVAQAWLTDRGNHWLDVQPLLVYPPFASSLEG